MTAYSYDMIRYETQQHMARLANEAAAERLARQLESGTGSAPMAGVRWLRRVNRGWATRLIHGGAHAPVTARLS